MNQTNNQERAQLDKRIHKLYLLQVYSRWFLAIFFWLTFGSIAIWNLQEQISLLLEYFTWSAVRYGLAYNLGAAFCLSVPVGFTISTSIWQIQHLLFGISSRERYLWEQEVGKICETGSKDWRYSWICGSEEKK